MDTARLRAFAMLVSTCLEGMQRVQSVKSPLQPAAIFSLPFSLPYHVLMDAAAHQQISFHFSNRDI
jgi:hypothetical protein